MQILLATVFAAFFDHVLSGSIELMPGIFLACGGRHCSQSNQHLLNNSLDDPIFNNIPNLRYNEWNNPLYYNQQNSVQYGYNNYNNPPQYNYYGYQNQQQYSRPSYGQGNYYNNLYSHNSVQNYQYRQPSYAAQPYSTQYSTNYGYRNYGR